MKIGGKYSKVYALLIIAIVFVAVGVYFFLSYTESINEIIAKDVGERFEVDGGYVIMYEKIPPSIAEVVNEFKEVYVQYNKKDKEVYFIYNDGLGTYLMGYYNKYDGNLEVDRNIFPIQSNLIYRQLLDEKDGKVKVEINKKDYEFSLYF